MSNRHNNERNKLSYQRSSRKSFFLMPFEAIDYSQDSVSIKYRFKKYRTKNAKKTNVVIMIIRVKNIFFSTKLIFESSHILSNVNKNLIGREFAVDNYGY